MADTQTMVAEALIEEKIAELEFALEGLPKETVRKLLAPFAQTILDHLEPAN